MIRALCRCSKSGSLLSRLASRLLRYRPCCMGLRQTLHLPRGGSHSPSKKWPSLDALIVHAQQMKRILANGLNCGCLRMEDCAIELERGCCVGMSKACCLHQKVQHAQRPSLSFQLSREQLSPAQTLIHPLIMSMVVSTEFNSVRLAMLNPAAWATCSLSKLLDLKSSSAETL